MLALGLILAASGCAVLVALLNWLGLREWRAAEGAHWVERARVLYPARTAAQLNLLLLTGACAIAPLFIEDIRGYWPIMAVAGFIGAMFGSYPFARAILPELAFRTWLDQAAIGWGTRILVLAPFIIAVLVAPPEWNGRMAFVSVAFALVHLWTNTGGFARVWLCLGILKPVSKSTLALLEESFTRAEVWPREVMMFTSPLLVAYALPFRKALLFSSGTIEKCTSDELNAICLHELAHLTENRRTLVGRIFGSFSLYPLIFIRPAISTFGIIGLLPIYCVLLLLLFAAKRVGQKAEVRADRIAAELQKNEGSYARALLKIYSMNQMPAVMRGKRQLHPHLYDRLLKAGVTPEFERPAPPALMKWTVLVPISFLASLYLYFQIAHLN